MTNDPNAEILTASEFAVGVAKKELGKTLDYSKNSFKDLEALIQHVKSHFLKLKMEGKPTEQTVQRASLSIGGYLGEVIRRHHGGTWIAKNTVMKTLNIDGLEFSPILYVFERLTKDSDSSLENYWSDIHRKLYPQPSIDKNLPVPETPKKTATQPLEKKLLLVLGALVGLFVLCIVVFSISRSISANKKASIAATQMVSVRATKTACNAKFEDEMTRLLSDFFRQQNIADVTSRINLPEQISRLEDLRRDTWNMKIKSCEPSLHVLVINYMDLSILSYISFSGEDIFWEDKYIESLKALGKLDDEIISRGRREGIVQLFREKGYLYWEKLDDPNWKAETQG